MNFIAQPRCSRVLHISICAVFSILFLILVFPNASQAQVSSYTFRSETGTPLAYSPLTGGMILGAGGGLDDEYYDQVAIGFPFAFNNTNYSTVSISANGYVIFGGRQNLGDGYYRPLSNAIGAGTIAACGINLRGTANAALRVQTVGSAPNRSFIIQWQQFGLVQFTNVVPTDLVNVQIRLDEGTNIVSISYGATTLADGASFDVGVGLRGNDEDFSVREVSPVTDALPNPWASSGAAASAEALCRLTVTRGASMQLLQGIPSSGLVYVWNPAPSLQTPQLLSPADGATFLIPGAFSWTPVQGATSYEVILVAPNGGTYPPITVQGTSVNFTRRGENSGYSNPMLSMPGQQFSFRVQAIGTLNGNPVASPVSLTNRFTPRAAPTITNISERLFAQGRMTNFTITVADANFTATAPRSVALVSDAGAVLNLGNVTVQNATTLAAGLNPPTQSPTGVFRMVIVTTQDSISLPNAVTIVSAANTPAEVEFRPGIHGHNFSNSLQNIWSQAVWSRIDYSSAVYPPEVRATAPEQSTFPSWDDFTAVYERGRGESAFTVNPSGQRSPRQEAIEQWRTQRKKWGGSCGGFAITALMHYSGGYTFPTPAFQLPLNDNLRTLINRNQVGQSYGQIIGRMSDTPNQTVQSVRTAFTQSKDKLPVLAVFNIVNGENKGGHALVPYRIVTRTEANGDVVDDVFVWDMNYPNDNERKIIVNRTKNFWQYFGFLNADRIMQEQAPWQGPNGFYMYLDASTAAAVPQNTSFKTAARTNATNPELEQQIEVYFADDNEDAQAIAPRVTATNDLGQSVANFGDLLIRPQIAGARVELPISTGATVDVPGLTIPRQARNIVSLSYLPTKNGSANYLSANRGRFAAEMYWIASSTNAQQRLNINFDRDSLVAASSNDVRDAEISLIKSDPTDDVWQNTITFSDLNFAANDSVAVRLFNDGNTFVLHNFGAARTYRIFMERYDTTAFANVRIGARESQRFVIEDWDNIGTCDVMVQVSKNLATKTDSIFYLRRAGMTTSVRNNDPLVKSDILRLQAYPNPVQEEAFATFVLPKAMHVRLEIVDVLGRSVAMVADANYTIGRHTLPVPQAQNLVPGMYFLRIQADNITAVTPLRVLR